MKIFRKTEEEKKVQSSENPLNLVFPNWLLWISLIILTITEIFRFMAGGNQGFIILHYLMIFLLWIFPVACMWRIIRKTTSIIKYPIWLLWILLILFVLFKLDNGISWLISGLSIFAFLINLFFSTLIPAYCIWKVIRTKQKGKFICEVCNKKYSTFKEAEKCENSHTKCDICGERLATLKDLEVHKRLAHKKK